MTLEKPCDHLGSISLVLDTNGGILEQQRYLPFGAPRTMPPYATVASTDFTYTGQRDLPGTGLMDYKARFYSPYLNHFTQPDSIVPDPYNSLDWNRYSYARYNPVRYTDPSGHSVDCGLGDPYCKAGKYTPNGLIQLYKQVYGRESLKRPYDSPNIIRERLSQEIEDFLVENPDYRVKNDKFSSNNYGLFYDIRHDYWRDRCSAPGSGCDAMLDPDKLFYYYDLHQPVFDTKFDLSRIDWNNTALDAVGIPLAIFGANVLRFGRGGTNIMNAAGGVGDAVSLYDASQRNDTVGQWLSVGGALPGIGAQVSAVSLIYDIGQGVYKVEWIPSIPR